MIMIVIMIINIKNYNNTKRQFANKKPASVVNSSQTLLNKGDNDDDDDKINKLISANIMKYRSDGS